MSMVAQVMTELKTAMKARDKERVAALRGIRASFLDAMKADGSDDLSDEASFALLRRLAKQRRESIVAFEEGGRDELAAGEKVELAVIESFLPSLADEATTAGWVDEAIAASGATSMKDMGKIMGHLMKHHKAELDAKLANTIVKAKLS